MAAEYELEYLLLEGHCYDITTGQPPRGLQFTLGTSANPVIVDTIVMANLVRVRLELAANSWSYSQHNHLHKPWNIFEYVGYGYVVFLTLHRCLQIAQNHIIPNMDVKNLTVYLFLLPFSRFTPVPSACSEKSLGIS